jgi:hypothetical protein
VISAADLRSTIVRHLHQAYPEAMTGGFDRKLADVVVAAVRETYPGLLEEPPGAGRITWIGLRRRGGKTTSGVATVSLAELPGWVERSYDSGWYRMDVRRGPDRVGGIGYDRTQERAWWADGPDGRHGNGAGK